jgi:molybdenum cofactor synthesis domain-containing protein
MKNPAQVKRVAILVIGDEVLAGDVEESNASFLSRELTRLGASVERIVVLHDDEDVIADELRKLARNHDAVLATGGIGVTHDDVTRQAVARAMKLPLGLHREAHRIVREFFGERMNRWHRRLAELPLPSRLIPNPAGSAPGFVTGNVYVFPGVPRMLRAMLPLVASEFAGPPLLSREIFTALPESAFAGPLGRIARESPAVAIGSYPLSAGGRWKVKLVVKSRRPELVDRACGRIERMLERLTTR